MVSTWRWLKVKVMHTYEAPNFQSWFLHRLVMGRLLASGLALCRFLKNIDRGLKGLLMVMTGKTSSKGLYLLFGEGSSYDW